MKPTASHLSAFLCQAFPTFQPSSVAGLAYLRWIGDQGQEISHFQNARSYLTLCDDDDSLQRGTPTKLNHRSSIRRIFPEIGTRGVGPCQLTFPVQLLLHATTMGPCKLQGI